MSKWQPENVETMAISVQIAREACGWQTRVFVRFRNRTGFVKAGPPVTRKREAQSKARAVARDLYPLLGALFCSAVRWREQTAIRSS